MIFARRNLKKTSIPFPMMKPIKQRIYFLMTVIHLILLANAQSTNYRLMQQQHQNNRPMSSNDQKALEAITTLSSLEELQRTTSNDTINTSDIFQLQHHLTIGQKISKILNESFENYDKRVRPNYGGPPVDVNVTMHIISISSVSEINMDFTADFYFRQTWRDPRLRFKRSPEIQTLFVGAEVSKKMWIPDTFFGNEKMAYFHEATTPNVFVRIDHTGEVYRSIRLTVTSSCAMRLQYFPMDRQQCTIEVESYGYNVRDIIYHWKGSNAVERDKTISLPQFDVIKTEQKTRTEELSSGSYSRLVAEIHFSRRMGYYLIQIYIPSSLIVVISWVSFWLHRNASPARVQLGVTTVLTMTTLMSSTNAALPKISYVKSIDIFLGTCFLMVFAALLEYATVGYLGKRIAMRKAKASALLSHSIAMTQHLLAQQQQDQQRDQQQQQQQQANNNSCKNQTSQPIQSAGDNNNNKNANDRSFSTNQQTNQLAAAAAHLIRLQRSHQQQNILSHQRHQQQQDHLDLYDQNNHTAGQVSPSNFIEPEDPEAYGQEANLTGSSGQRRLIGGPPIANSIGAPIGQASCQPTIGPAAASCLVIPPIAAEQIHKNYYQSSDNLASYLTTNPYFASSHKQPYQHHHQPAYAHNPFNARAYLATGSSNPHLHSRYSKMNNIFGLRPSDVDKYSRVVFPVCFLCFQLMYWIVYLHISAFLEEEVPNR